MRRQAGLVMSEPGRRVIYDVLWDFATERATLKWTASAKIKYFPDFTTKLEIDHKLGLV